ncbi:MAG: Crp/Fnr family transcriptional regulator [Chloroflexi bacterium]|nr:Crp/Fnr family transcriptional regulator [Chloroflexota bacterium]
MAVSTDFLRSLPYLANLAADDVERVRRDILELSFDKDEFVLLEGEPCRGLYVVKSGRIRIFKSSPEGREHVLLVAGAGESFNDVPVFDDGPNPASGTALEPSVVYLIPKKTALALVADCPAALGIIRVFAARLRRLATVVSDLSFRSVVSRIAKLLLEMAVAEQAGTPIPRLTQDEMAARVGSVRDVVGRALRTLEKAGAIEIRGQRLVVTQPQKLLMLVEDYDKSRMP